MDRTLFNIGVLYALCGGCVNGEFGVAWGSGASLQEANAPKSGPMSIKRTLGFLYWLAHLVGDINAIQKDRVGRRIRRRIAGKFSDRGFRKLFR